MKRTILTGIAALSLMACGGGESTKPTSEDKLFADIMWSYNTESDQEAICDLYKYGSDAFFNLLVDEIELTPGQAQAYIEIVVSEC